MVQLIFQYIFIEINIYNKYDKLYLPFNYANIMDISSAYFSKLENPAVFVKKYLWKFLLNVYKVDKIRELFSFVIWEVIHKAKYYKFSDSYLKFSPHNFVNISFDSIAKTEREINSPFLQERKLQFISIPIDWKYCVVGQNNVVWGVRYSNANTFCVSKDDNKTALPLYTFEHRIQSFFMADDELIFVCANGLIYRSEDLGRTFTIVLNLSTRESYFLFNNGMTETPNKILFIGEYGSIWLGNKWVNLAFLYQSNDGGHNWEKSNFLIQQGVNKHIHLVKYSKLIDALFLTDGDNKKQVWIKTNILKEDKAVIFKSQDWYLLNFFHFQLGGYTSMCESNNTIIFGTDYLGGTNFVVRTRDGKHFKRSVMPDPYRRSPIMNMVNRSVGDSKEVWACSYSCLANKTRNLLMCSVDDGKTWARIFDFSGSDTEIRLVSSSIQESSELYISITYYESCKAFKSITYKLSPTI